MRYIEAKVGGKPVRLEVLKETPQDDGQVKVLVIPPGGVGAQSIVVEPGDIKEG